MSETVEAMREVGGFEFESAIYKGMTIVEVAYHYRWPGFKKGGGVGQLPSSLIETVKSATVEVSKQMAYRVSTATKVLEETRRHHQHAKQLREQKKTPPSFRACLR